VEVGPRDGEEGYKEVIIEAGVPFGICYTSEGGQEVLVSPSLMLLRLPLRSSQPSPVGHSLQDDDSDNGTLGPTDFSFPAGTFFFLGIYDGSGLVLYLSVKCDGNLLAGFTDWLVCSARPELMRYDPIGQD